MFEFIKVDGVWGSFDFATGLHLPQESAVRSRAEIAAELEAAKDALLKEKEKEESLARYHAQRNADLAKELRDAMDILQDARDSCSHFTTS